jgi:hypothetical protein
VIAPPQRRAKFFPQFARKTKILTHSFRLLVYVFGLGSNVHCGMTLTEIYYLNFIDNTSYVHAAKKSYAIINST